MLYFFAYKVCIILPWASYFDAFVQYRSADFSGQSRLLDKSCSFVVSQAPSLLFTSESFTETVNFYECDTCLDSLCYLLFGDFFTTFKLLYIKSTKAKFKLFGSLTVKTNIMDSFYQWRKSYLKMWRSKRTKLFDSSHSFFLHLFLLLFKLLCNPPSILKQNIASNIFFNQ